MVATPLLLVGCAGLSGGAAGSAGTTSAVSASQQSGPALSSAAATVPPGSVSASTPPSSAPAGSGSVSPSTASTTPDPQAPPQTKLAADGSGSALIVGTDSETVPAAPSPVTPQIQALLDAFGHQYLEYDYRADPAARAEALRSLVTPQLFQQLSQPLPAAMVETLRAEHRVVTATLVSVQPVDAGVYQIAYAVDTRADGVPAAKAQPRSLVVTVDGQQRVSDVR